MHGFVQQGLIADFLHVHCRQHQHDLHFRSSVTQSASGQLLSPHYHWRSYVVHCPALGFHLLAALGWRPGHLQADLAQAQVVPVCLLPACFIFLVLIVDMSMRLLHAVTDHACSLSGAAKAGQMQ